MTLLARWIDDGEMASDFYELAGKARFHPQSDELLAELNALLQQSLQHPQAWQANIADRLAHLQTQLQQAISIFSNPDARRQYDQRLESKLRTALSREFGSPSENTPPKSVRRWLRMTQNVHPSRLDELTRRLTTAIQPSNEPAEPAVPVVQPSPQVAVAVQSPQNSVSPAEVPAESQSPTDPAPAQHETTANQSIARPRPPRFRPRPPNRGDDFGLLWIVSSAVVTSVFVLLLLFWLFGNRFGAGKQDTQIARDSPSSAPPESDPPTSAPVRANNDSPHSRPPADSSKPSSIANDSNGVPPESQSPPPPRANPEPAPTAQAKPGRPGADKTSPPQPGPATGANPQSPGKASPTAPSTTTASGGRQSFPFGRPVHALAWDSATKQLAIGGEGGEIALWEPDNDKSQRLTDTFSACSALAFGPTGKSLAASTPDGVVLLWNIATGKAEKPLRHADLANARTMNWLSGSGDSRLVVGDGAGQIRIFSVGSGSQQAVLDLAADAGPVASLAVLSKNRSRIVSGHLGGAVVCWNLDGKSVLKCLARPDSAMESTLQKSAAASSKTAEFTPWMNDTCYCVSASPDERLLAIAANDLELWELESTPYMVRKRLLPGANDSRGYRVAAFSGDGAFVAAGNNDGTLTVVDAQAWSVVALEKFSAAINALDWHPTNHRRVAVGLADGTVVVVPLARDIVQRKAAPDFNMANLLATLKTKASEEEWSVCARLIVLLSAYQLPLSEKNELDAIRFKANKAIQDDIKELDPRSIEIDAVADAALALQMAIDMDPTSGTTLGRRARELLRQLPPRTPTMFAKAAASAAADSKTTSKTTPPGRSRSMPPPGRPSPKPTRSPKFP